MNENRPTHRPSDDALQRCAGFTLIELLTVLVISSIVLTGIYSVFQAQLKAANTNTQVVMMQQNLRAAMAIIERDIRMAGYSPSGVADAGFVEAQEGLLQVTIDWNNDGDVADNDEDVTYGFLAADDADRDGVLDALGVESLRRDWGAGMQPMANNIQAFAFAYAFDDDRDGNLDTSGGNVIWAIDSNADGTLDLNVDTGAALGTTANLNRIQAVRVTLLARSGQTIRDYTSSRNYQIGRNVVGGGGDAFMRRTLETIVKCRNMD